jgi:HEAT repeat protein
MAGLAGYGIGKPAVLRGGPSSVPVLIDLAHSDDAKVRREAIAGLCDWGRGRDSDTVIPVLREALTDPQPEVALLAATCLAAQGSDGEKALVQALWELPPERVYVTFPAFQNLRLRGAAEYLRALRHPDGKVRTEGLKGLRHVAHRRPVESGDYLTRLVAVSGWCESVYAREDELAMARLRTVLADPDALLRATAAEALLRRNKRDGEVVRVSAAAGRDADVAVRWTALQLLRWPRFPLDWKVQQEWLLAALGDADRPIQELAEAWFLDAGPPGVPLLVKALHASDRRTRSAAARTLSKLGPNAVWALPDSDSERKLREKVARVLKEVE